MQPFFVVFINYNTPVVMKTLRLDIEHLCDWALWRYVSELQIEWLTCLLRPDW